MTTSKNSEVQWRDKPKNLQGVVPIIKGVRIYSMKI